MNQATSTVYVANEGTTSPGDTVSVINAATCIARRTGCGQAPATVTVGSAPLGVAANPVTNTVYVTNFGDFAGDTVSVINGAACNGVQHSGCGQAPASVTVGAAPWGLAIGQAANTIYVANNYGGDSPASLSVINGATCDGTNTSGCGKTPPAIAGIGRAPNGIAFDPATHTVYTANALDATVSVVNLARGQAPPLRAAAQSRRRQRPRSARHRRSTHTIYVADSFDGTLSVLPECPVHAEAEPARHPRRRHKTRRHPGARQQRPAAQLSFAAIAHQVAGRSPEGGRSRTGPATPGTGYAAWSVPGKQPSYRPRGISDRRVSEFLAARSFRHWACGWENELPTGQFDAYGLCATLRDGPWPTLPRESPAEPGRVPEVGQPDSDRVEPLCL